MEYLLKMLIIVVITACLFIAHPRKKSIEIISGMSGKEVAGLLKKEGIIINPDMFLFFLGLTGQAKNLRAGIYVFSTGANYVSIINKLVSGSDFYVKVTIPEGFTAEQIADRLSEKKIIDDPEKFVEQVEKDRLRGFLFPDTYNFSPNTDSAGIIEIMKKQFYDNFSIEYIRRARELGFSIKEIVTLASLIEKEARVSRERPIISAIFQKRLKKRMYLESCASVLFALGEHKKKLTYKDLKIDSPYNTYRKFGLPPTPICNPGRASLHAALYPGLTDYLYFFSRGDGSHIFSRSYEEHLRKQKNFKY
jgi:UPF0755 protein